MTYTIDRTVDAPFEAVVDAVTEELEGEGFGVLTEIDVQQTMREKLDAAFRDYRILGACNPALAHDALEREEAVGALLPCNVTVYANGDGTVTVAAVDPHTMLGVAGNQDLAEIADEAAERLTRVVDAVKARY